MDVKSEEFQCPICFHIPGKEIFQCVEGHILCDQCSANPNLQNCPQCDASLRGIGKSRNRMLEALLDKIQFNCAHSEMGCPEKMARKNLSSHEAACEFGQTVEFCKMLGYTNCSFKAPKKLLHGTIAKHLQEIHKSTLVLTNGKGHVINWTHFYQVDHPQRMQPQCYILKEKDHLPALLLVCRIQDDFATWTCFELGAVGQPHHVCIEVFANKIWRTRYEIPAIPVTEAEQFMKQPPFRMSIGYFTQVGGNFKTEKGANLEFSVKILPGVEVPNINSNAAGAAFLTPGMPPNITPYYQIDPRSPIYATANSIQQIQLSRNAQIPPSYVFTGTRTSKEIQEKSNNCQKKSERRKLSVNFNYKN